MRCPLVTFCDLLSNFRGKNTAKTLLKPEILPNCQLTYIVQKSEFRPRLKFRAQVHFTNQLGAVLTTVKITGVKIFNIANPKKIFLHNLFLVGKKRVGRSLFLCNKYTSFGNFTEIVGVGVKFVVKINLH